MYSKSLLALACLSILISSCSRSEASRNEVYPDGEPVKKAEKSTGITGMFKPFIARKRECLTFELKEQNAMYFEGERISFWYLKQLLACEAKNAAKDKKEGETELPLKVVINAQGDICQQTVVDMLEQCALAGITKISLAHPGVNSGSEVELFLPQVAPPCGNIIAVKEHEGKPAITLQMLIVELLWVSPTSTKASSDPKKGRTLLKERGTCFPFVADKETGGMNPDFMKFFRHVCAAKKAFHPTKSYRELPVVIDAKPVIPFEHVLAAVHACKKAGINNVYFARLWSPTRLVTPGGQVIPRGVSFNGMINASVGAYAPGGRARAYKPIWGRGRLVKKPIIILDEEIEITKDIPRGTSFDNLSCRSLDSTSCVDAYGIGGGRAGAYGQRWGKQSLAREGGSPGTESAVTAALRWLHFHQNRNGQWDQDGFHKNCDKNKGTACDGAGTSQYDVGVTGLALLAFLGSGHTHRVGQFKKTVKRGLDWLVLQQAKDGAFRPEKPESAESWVYNHAIATAALCEAYAITRDYKLKAPAQRAVDYIRSSRNPGLAWKYEPKDGRNDTSVTGWMVMALKAAKMAGLSVDKFMFDGAINWFDRATNTAGKCGYMRPGDDGAIIRNVNQHYAKLPAMTGISVACRILCGQKRQDVKVVKGVNILMTNLPNWNKPKNHKVDMYYWYWGTRAMFQYGGKNWQKWNKAVKKALLDTQRVGGCADGSWDPVGKWGMVGGRVYATAINCLTLEIYYRYARTNPPKHITRNK